MQSQLTQNVRRRRQRCEGKHSDDDEQHASHGGASLMRSRYIYSVRTSNQRTFCEVVSDSWDKKRETRNTHLYHTHTYYNIWLKKKNKTKKKRKKNKCERVFEYKVLRPRSLPAMGVTRWPTSVFTHVTYSHWVFLTWTTPPASVQILRRLLTLQKHYECSVHARSFGNLLLMLELFSVRACEQPAKKTKRKYDGELDLQMQLYRFSFQSK